jgi:predicted acyl esterase
MLQTWAFLAEHGAISMNGTEAIRFLGRGQGLLKSTKNGLGSMIGLLGLLLQFLMTAPSASAQELEFRAPAGGDKATLERAIRDLAKRFVSIHQNDGRSEDARDLFWAQLAAGQYAQAEANRSSWRTVSALHDSPQVDASILPFELYSKAKAQESTGQVSFDEAFRQAFTEVFNTLDDRTAIAATAWFGPVPLDQMRGQLRGLLERQEGKDRITSSAALDLCRRYVFIQGYGAIAPLTEVLIAQDDARRYIIQDDVLIKTTRGATLSAIIVRSRRSAAKQPAALFTVVETVVPRQLYNAKYAASRGYVGVSSDAHGKRLSPDKIVLYENDAVDLHGVIDWISKQPWCDGQVGMYGGSNAGFMVWAAAKTLHPALKTIVPYVPLDPGFGLPMTNNVFLTANYDLPFYLGNTKYLDPNFGDRGRYGPMLWRWYHSGRPYREIDQVDGHPNRWLQRWLDHPAYDKYWQGMTANGTDYDKLNIPVLAIDGYYDDGQINAVRRLQEHYRHRPDAEHYLVIGPYDHFDTQGPVKAAVLRGYTIDPVAHFDTPNLTFQWFDYVLKGGAKPAILQDKINYQVMGANAWKHAPSIEKMSEQMLTLYLTSTRVGNFYQLAAKPPAAASVKMIVDFADRTAVSTNTYPSEIVTRDLSLSQGLAFISDPFDAPISVNGLFSATLRTIINKKDLDIVMALYEVMPSGEYFHLSDTVARASYAKNMTKRQLLAPHKVETITLDKTLLVSRQLSKGSRLLLVLDVNRGPFAQVNYGTGKDVSDESIADAKEPLRVEWLKGSYVKVPVSR